MSPATSKETLSHLIDFTLEELASGDDERFAEAFGQLLAALDRPPAAADVEKLLGDLRGARRFAELGRLADRLVEVGSEEPIVRRQYAQALIDQGYLKPAQMVLEELANSVPKQHREYGEALGLLGRVHKQRFVRAADRDRAADELGKAVGYYGEVYPSDPAWHGANLVALVWRAEQEGVFAGGRDLAETVDEVLADLTALPAEKHDHWLEAGLGEVHLGKADYEAASLHYGRFIQHEKIDAFALGSAARQLREIWGIEPGEETPGGTILLALDAKRLGEPGGTLQYSPADMASVAGRVGKELDDPGPGVEEQLQALLGENPQLPLKTLRRLLDRAPWVCRVVEGAKFDRQIRSGGTGFLVDRAVLQPGATGPPLLVTNAHVLTETGTGISVRREAARAVFDFWAGDDRQVSFRIREILWSSPVKELDATVAELEMDDALAAQAAHCEIDRRDVPLNAPDHEPKDKVYIIGHPAGRGLEFSLADNEVIDHDINDPEPSAPGRRRIHYQAPTEGGSSGSPVFDQDEVAVIGLHRAAAKRPLRDGPAEDGYVANEAVWFRSIIEAYPAS